MRTLVLACLIITAGCTRSSPTASADGLKQPNEASFKQLKEKVEILRDRWGVPHIYAKNQADLFFANGYINARDRLFQLDLWRRSGTGQLAEALGDSYVERDRMARLFRYRGDWQKEWSSYSADTYEIATAFTNGINAYIQSLNGSLPEEFVKAGFRPGFWKPEDVVARIAGLSISRNVTSEILFAQDVTRYGAPQVRRARLFSPPPDLTPKGIDLSLVSAEVVRGYSDLFTAPTVAQGSNNWVVDGSLSATGKPLFASDPHRGLEIPSLRRTIHLNAPGWNAIGAGEPALPGIALGHNDRIAFGFTITGTDQQDLYVEKLNPANPRQYWFQGAWRQMEVIKEEVAVKGGGRKAVELEFTAHGPVIYRDDRNRSVYALKWAGMEPGGAGYLASLGLARAKDWSSFLQALGAFHVPSENMLYADVDGNIGLAIAARTPVRAHHDGALPVSGSGDYEWTSYLKSSDLPRYYNPPEHFLATSNNDIRPPNYGHLLTHEWSPPFRVERVREVLRGGTKFSVGDFEKLQYDVVSLPARRYQALLAKWQPNDTTLKPLRDRFLAWDTRVTPESAEATMFEFAIIELGRLVLGPDVGARSYADAILTAAEAGDGTRSAGEAFTRAIGTLRSSGGFDPNGWQLNRVSRLIFHHPIDSTEYNRGPYPRMGDTYTVNAAGGNGLRYGEGASYRQVLDLADWDRSTMTNAPGESGDPKSKHYSDLVDDWRAGKYHPMAFSRAAVEKVTEERITLLPQH